MPTMFNSLLTQAGLDLADVRILRHKDKRALTGRSPYDLWRDDRDAFLLYQSLQNFEKRQRLNAPYWASFVVTPSNRNMFVGIYEVSYKGILSKDVLFPSSYTVDEAESCDEYNLRLSDYLSDFIGKLFIEWGPGARARVQRADLQDKRVLEILT